MDSLYSKRIRNGIYSIYQFNQSVKSDEIWAQAGFGPMQSKVIYSKI